MRLIPGEVRAVAGYVTGSVRAGVDGAVADLSALFELIGRATALMDDAERLMARASQAVTGAEEQLARTRDLLDRAEAMVTSSEELLEPVRPVLAETIPALSRALPMAAHVLDSVDPGEVDAVVRTINHLPALVDTLEQQVLPNLSMLEQVGPDVRDILSNVTGLSEALLGMPGMAWAQRRGARRTGGAAPADPGQAPPGGEGT